MIDNNKIIIFGVCYWLSLKFDLSTSGVRVLFLIMLIVGVGSPLLLYLILYIIKPKII